MGKLIDDTARNTGVSRDEAAYAFMDARIADRHEKQLARDQGEKIHSSTKPQKHRAGIQHSTMVM